MPEVIDPTIIERPHSEDARIQLIPPWAVLGVYDIQQSLGSVLGVTFHDLGMLPEITAGLKNIVGGKEKKVEKGYERAHSEAVTEMRESAEKLGANAVLNFKTSDELITDPYTRNVIIKTIAEGVAVQLKDKKQRYSN